MELCSHIYLMKVIMSKKFFLKTLFKKMSIYKKNTKLFSTFWLKFYQRIFSTVIWKIYFLLLHQTFDFFVSVRVSNKIRYLTNRWTYYKLIDLYRRNWYLIFFIKNEEFYPGMGILMMISFKDCFMKIRVYK